MALSRDHLSARMAALSIRAASSSFWASSRCSRPMADRSSSMVYESCSDSDETTVSGLSAKLAAAEKDATSAISPSKAAASAAAAAILRACEASLLRRAITLRANRASSICSRCLSSIILSNLRFVDSSFLRIRDSAMAVPPLTARPGPYDPPYGFRDSMVGCNPPKYFVSSVGTSPVRAAAECMVPLSSSLA